MTSIDSQLPSFEDFFRALWNKDPFPWQSLLAQRVTAENWPKIISLPTAAGKTACIEIALYALAAQANQAPAARTAPRRIWFVVDRRIVVDAAYDRARCIAQELARATEGPLHQVAQRLRAISGTDHPLVVSRLRGGVSDDAAWARLPSQVSVITSTVDQLGSRLLFRNYAATQLTAPIHAALAAHDSLILLDEAHCSAPFAQTLDAIQLYRGERWAELPLNTPFAFVLLSATPRSGLEQADIFPGPDVPQALDHPLLLARIFAAKPARLFPLPHKRKTDEDPLVAKAQELVAEYIRQGCVRTAVIMNRVRTAQLVAEGLQATQPNIDVILLTGRLRPIERDALIDAWLPYLRAESPRTPHMPLVVVSTQCLEVGADFSFDGLITEAASLDALRQRFGRLNRLGTSSNASAAILIRERDMDERNEDPVYGQALSRCWKLLEELAQTSSSREHVDFGTHALDTALSSIPTESLEDCAAPAPNAPALLPAHLDLLCQTAPPPAIEPEVSLYLHGRDRTVPEAYLVWRADLPPGNLSIWPEAVSLCPPLAGELLSVPLYRLRSWLGAPDSPDDTHDVEGSLQQQLPEAAAAYRPFLLWRGRDSSFVDRDPEQIVPGDIVVVPAAYGMDNIGQATRHKALGEAGLDLWEPALAATDRPPAVRLHHTVLAPWLDCPPLRQLVELISTPGFETEDLWTAVDTLLAYQPLAPEEPQPPPSWWLELLSCVRGGRIEQHPAGGIVLFARRPRAAAAPLSVPDLFADEDDLASTADVPISLEDHTRHVVRTLEKLCSLCLPESSPETSALLLAALWHDAGKLDERFQILLHQGDELAALAADQPLAKSPDVPLSHAQRRRIREATGLPQSFRHEMLSAALAQRFADLPSDVPLAELTLHLIAAHHGYARPFAPVCKDPHPPDVLGNLANCQIHLSGSDRAKVPAHSLDSSIANRFWRNLRRYGWWGLAYLEALLRLADWYASARPSQSETSQELAYERA
ncbi:MAG: type I-U CRISPR-associated helicase/endonuclease Cas3 [Pirellulales bacterium]|nr:type I-U CRISPR-associated helicase/endonuclease Cas3 [Pirellulales bacterium]